MPELPEPTTVSEEIAALKKVVAALDQLDVTAQQRSLRWLIDRYSVTIHPNGGDPA